MAISFDYYKLTGKKTERVVVADMKYLNKRFMAFCPTCEQERLHDPVCEARKCLSCDDLHKDTDLGVVTWRHYVGEKARWVKQ